MTLSYDLKNDAVLIVDDTPENITLLSSLLKGIYRLKFATNGKKAIQSCILG